jgi:heat shock protein HslJ
MHRFTFLSAFLLVFVTSTAGIASAQSLDPTKVSLMLHLASDQTPPSTAGANKPLEGTYWRATELAGKPAPPPPKDSTRETHLQFHEGRVSGSDGCNLLTGSYHLNGDRVTFSQMAGTQMACVNMEATEGPFRDALNHGVRLTIAGDRLELFDAAGKRLAAFIAATPPPAPKPSTKALTGFAGTSWQLVKFQSMDDTTLKPDDRSKYTIEFQGGGRLAVRIDCNRGTGTWKSAGESQIEFGPLATTRAQCPPGSLFDQIVRQWPNIRSYVLRDGHLFLALKMDGGIYEFEPLAK